MNNKENKKDNTQEKSKGITRITADIADIDKEAEVKLSRVQEKNRDSPENNDSERDFNVSLKVSKLKGSLAMADIIKENDRSGKKRRIL